MSEVPPYSTSRSRQWTLPVLQKEQHFPCAMAKDWYCIARQPAPAPNLARPDGLAALTHTTHVLQGYLAHKKQTTPLQDSTVGSCLGPYGGPRGGVVSCERGTPVITVLRVSRSCECYMNGRGCWRPCKLRPSINASFLLLRGLQDYLAHKKQRPPMTLR
jgi:hypothetical protein